ncbi:MAG: tetratricopeptide repeat protein [Chthoniobacterales bacterium]
MKASRLIFTLLFASSVAVAQLAVRRTKADEEPIEQLRAKADAGDAKAQYSLAVCYERGEGVAEDKVEAVKWYRKAAEQNFAAAQYNLGVCYYHGEGVAKDKKEAVKWFRKAAEQNDAQAQGRLGLCYVEGEGVPVDLVEAYKWVVLAARQGNENATKFILATLNPALTPQQRAQGQKLADEFKPH